MPASPSAEQLAAQAAELEAIRRRVINVVGHELRTPVTTIHGLATELESAEDLDAVRTVIGPALLRNAERLTTLLDDLLVASGIQTAIPVDTPGTVELRTEIIQLWADVGGAASEQPMVTGGPVEVSGPLVGVRRALRAVLDNAVRYGSGTPRISLTDGDQVGVEVFSPGPPLKPDEVHLATEAFFRGERAVTTAAGLGIGLSIAKAVAERAGGTVEFESTAGGTTTRIELPKAPTQ